MKIVFHFRNTDQLKQNNTSNRLHFEKRLSSIIQFLKDNTPCKILNCNMLMLNRQGRHRSTKTYLAHTPLMQSTVSSDERYRYRVRTEPMSKANPVLNTT